MIFRNSHKFSQNFPFNFSIKGTSLREAIGVNENNHFLLRYETNAPNTFLPSVKIFRLEPLAFLDLSPSLTFSKFPTLAAQDTLVSLPSNCQ